MLLKNGIDLFDGIQAFIDQSSNLTIFCPYIKLGKLKELLKHTDNCKQIVVRWLPSDLQQGISDLGVYSFCKQHHITLYRNPRLHLKAYIDDFRQCLLGSANISNAAINDGALNNYNHEIATIVDLDLESSIYFQKIIHESAVVDDRMFASIQFQLDQLERIIIQPEDFQFPETTGDQHFLISALPMSYSVPLLKRIYFDQKRDFDKVDLACAAHDLALYRIPKHLDENAFLIRLSNAFFHHPFILAFLDHLQTLNGEIYFGQAKTWIQDNTTTVPTPRKWELTENTQILYRWIIDLGKGNYQYDKPRHSERLFLMNPNSFDINTKN